MELSYDPEKNQANIAKHGVSFEQVHEIEWKDAVILADDRRDYGEERYTVYAMLGGRLHVLVFTPRGEMLRPISFRKANAQERRRYDQ